MIQAILPDALKVDQARKNSLFNGISRMTLLFNVITLLSDINKEIPETATSEITQVQFERILARTRLEKMIATAHRAARTITPAPR